LRLDVKQKQRALYGKGDYSALAAVLEPAAIALVDAVDVAMTHAVLDVAAGDGNGALAALRRGARVTATDLSPVQVRRGENRSAREGRGVQWLVADAERLPFNADAFDRVMSVFGVIFAPRPEAAVAELFRVCKPRGTVGLTSWPDDGYMGQLTAALRETLVDESLFPDPELGWGNEKLIRARLQAHARKVVITRKTLRWDPAVRAAAGRNDCAATYFASHVPNEMLPQLGNARDRVEQQFKTSDGLLRADYLIATAANESAEAAATTDTG